jgi:ABC-type multidrug transport system ATPase subunit
MADGLKRAESGEAFSWNIESGRVCLVTGSAPGRLLDVVAGRVLDKRLGVKFETANGGALRVGLLPPPGEEIFSGTTIGEQLDFFAREGSDALLEEDGLDGLFGFGFAGRRDESVWELGSGEMRCLLLVSQALAGPCLWVLNQPLARLDGPRCRAMREFIGRRGTQGDAVVISEDNSLELLDCSTELLAVDGNALIVQFHGAGKAAAEYMASERCVPLPAVQDLLRLA